MKQNDFALYRNRIGQTQEKIAELLDIPLNIYQEIEENKRDVSERVSHAFYSLFSRVPGSVDVSKPKIKAIDDYKTQYKNKTGKLPKGKHWIPFNVLGTEKILVDFSPYESDLNKGEIKTETEMWDWINAHDISPVITPEYFNHLTTLNNRELQEEVQFWDEVYTAQHYGKYKSKSTPKELEEKILEKKVKTGTYWINKANGFLIKTFVGLVILWVVARLIVLVG
jgi:DNA-binding XRE family transcriptional regulator